jgi:hypothetical protein
VAGSLSYVTFGGGTFFGATCMALVHFYNLLVKAIHALCTSLLANLSKNLFSSKSLRNQIYVQNSFILSFRESVGGGGD